MMIRTLTAALLLATPAAVLAQAAPVPVPQPAAPASVEALEPQLTGFFEAWMKQQHVPGLVYGVVKDGRMVLVRGLGVQDVASKRPVTADSRFRIASMSKAFTAMAILKLRDEERLSLAAPADRYVPEMRGWRYPTADSRRIRVADLLHHNAGLVEDNPWGDRQQPLSERSFTAMLKAGVPFAQAPGLKMEYSNLGYATLGRIVSNVSGTRYQDYIGREIMAPLGMTATGYDVLNGPQEFRALGYRWQDNAWVREPDMADGAFGAMGGVQTSANDYWRWIAFLLSGWPARDDAEAGPVKRATVREIVEGANFVSVQERRGPSGNTCRAPVAYAMGWSVVNDCDLGRIVTHSGGYPGYGSIVMMLPDTGVAVFAFANRTYAGPGRPVGQALYALRQAGLATDRAVPVSADLARAYTIARDVWRTGDPAKAPLANNVVLDRDLARRRKDIADLRKQVGTCRTDAAIVPSSAMEGTFTWTCASGTVNGRVQRAPTPALSLQVLSFTAAQ
ncbi:serine hydrolase domain-containing protein [Sphingomonas jeddahensis]|uniref:Penicillin-binding protein 4 n=1 Tax=Sphingomonas jeddahensis TaxID=1915074 RepID=A0A1V2EXV0_9SPHN|nr:serine hydrolase domain-containing protein [Sphingomonas jeddahensis]ONF97496.1 Penicillin-binding protein 4* [Sphingomonas jeddahensis]